MGGQRDDGRDPHRPQVIWDRERGPTYVRSKLRDFALVGFAGVLVVAAFAFSLVVRIVVETGVRLSDWLGWSGVEGFASTVVEVTAATIVVFVALLALYRVVPPVTMRLRLLWPSAAAAAIAFEVAVCCYAIYATRFASFKTVYGPIGAVLGFLLLVYLLAAIVLLGAATAAGALAGGLVAGDVGGHGGPLRHTTCKPRLWPLARFRRSRRMRSSWLHLPATAVRSTSMVASLSPWSIVVCFGNRQHCAGTRRVHQPGHARARADTQDIA